MVFFSKTFSTLYYKASNLLGCFVFVSKNIFRVFQSYVLLPRSALLECSYYIVNCYLPIHVFGLYQYAYGILDLFIFLSACTNVVYG